MKFIAVHDALFNHVHPVAAGAGLSIALPWDHATNAVWAVAGSVISWAIVQGLSAAWKKLRSKRHRRPR